MTFSRAAIAALTLGACGLTSVNHEERIPETTIPGSPSGVYTPGVTYRVTFEIPPLDTGPATCVSLVDLELEITTPDDDWLFIDEADLYIESSLPGTGLFHRPIARAIMPSGRKTLRFAPIDDVDLLPYFDEGARIIALAKGDAPADAVSFDGTVTFLIETL